MAILTEDSVNIEIVEDTIDITLEDAFIYYGTGSGDMQTLVYDPDKDGVVNASETVVASVEAQEDFAKGDLISVDGKHPYSGDFAFRDRIAGIVLEDTLTGHAAKVAISGIIKNTAWNFKSSSVLYLNGKSLSEIAPTSGFVQEIGKAITATRILIDIKQSILL